jgi:hypothetical protein
MKEPLLICGVPRDEYMRRYFIACEKLRRFEGDSVTLVADDGEHDTAVDCVGGWTSNGIRPSYTTERFTGANIMLAMENAAKVWEQRYRAQQVPEARLGDWDAI